MHRQTSTRGDRASGKRRQRDFLMLAESGADAGSRVGAWVGTAASDLRPDLIARQLPGELTREEADGLRRLMAEIAAQLETVADLGDPMRRAAFEEQARELGRNIAASGFDPQWCLAVVNLVFANAAELGLKQNWPKGVFAGSRQHSLNSATAEMADLFAVCTRYTDLLWNGYSQEQRSASENAFEQRIAQEREAINQQFGHALRGLMVGDLGDRIEGAVPPQHRELAATFNVALDRVQTTFSAIVKTLLAGNEKAAAAATALTGFTAESAQAAERIEDITNALDAALSSQERAAEGADGVEGVIVDARRSAENGGKVMGRAVEAMNGIEGLTDRIGQITNAIDDIAFQTNLLALNAGIEAARAGDAGRGFAVVAQEVRALAQRSTEAAKEIEGLVGDTRSRIDRGVEAVNEAGTAIDDVVGRFAQIDTTASHAASENAQRSSEIERLRANLQAVGTRAAAVSSQSVSAEAQMGEVQASIVQLGEIVRRFRLGDETQQMNQATYSEELAVPDIPADLPVRRRA
ncbi:methyl-accepting chemotaxis protein [Hoeflea prorocentri]|uniref:Methyl-accepting chemotaxis protein n=1 Tax=Hoeflea prorocentri TaxID=1922333 RepID=A0A9X3ZIW5_9HYPH|nr:methyl-accepting chemotaxis protein [Hoeflea prorocentri]MCY6382423.1 methyl-accepting chemotaxis protein [Hoeflea prorocentri]MDA5400223.1 methyl-accepting chemotaxis protein [Hoeflea prorocentri]